VAARKEFLNKGYAGARVQEIAKRAGLTPAAIYRPFGDKAGLFLAVVEDAADAELNSMLRGVLSSDPAVALSGLGRRLIDRKATGRRLLLLEGFAAARVDDHLAALLRARLDRQLELFEGALVDLQREGRLRVDVGPAALARFLYSIALGNLIYESVGHHAGTTAIQQWEPMIDLIEETFEGST
jgi:AcrR family transcriptional regulator